MALIPIGGTDFDTSCGGIEWVWLPKLTSYGELGRAASFGTLPEGCRNLVLDTYQMLFYL